MAEDTLWQLLAAQAAGSPSAPALLAPGRSSLSYRGLLRQVEDAVEALGRHGIARDGRVAVVLPNGPELASLVLAVAAVAVCAPLNPAYREAEFEFYLDDLDVRALIVSDGSESPARAAATRRGIPVLDLHPVPDEPAGRFRLEGPSGRAPGTAQHADPDDVALVLHTSGTTSRPKRVPLTHRNLCSSARSIRAALSLTEWDRCLNVMPLFHIHGLVGAVLASLAAGAGVVCTPGFRAAQFFEWLEECRPTWYTAVPSMHQSILARASEHSGRIASCPLRFIRSASAPLPIPVLESLEATFGAPVVEAYGMTEAAHQIASNPLPSGHDLSVPPRKPGSVGRAAGPEVAVQSDDGRLLPAGERGEIVIRGPGVTAGYEGNEAANRAAFREGWLRTGDEGYLDAEGYLYLTGRLKEIINRGGEKIAPREVEEVLLAHPAVAQAVTFAVPHPLLGEEVGAAVVLRDAPRPTERELREFAARRLTDHKVPRRVLFLAELPKGPTGKLQRIGLAERLGITCDEPAEGVQTPYVAPQGPLETVLAVLWAEVLGRDPIGAEHRFLDVGGDSVAGALLVSRIRESLLVELPLLALFDDHADVAGIAEQLRRLAASPEALERRAALLLRLSQLSGEEIDALLLEREVQRERDGFGSEGFSASGMAQRPLGVPAE